MADDVDPDLQKLISEKFEPPEDGSFPDAEVDLEGVDLSDTSVEDQARGKAVAEQLGEAPEAPNVNLSDIPRNTTMEEDGLAFPAGMQDAFAAETDLGKVEADESDRTAFLRSALLGEPITFLIPISSMGIDIEIGCCTQKELQASANAVHRLTVEKRLDTPDQFMFFWQVLHTYIQVRKVDGVPLFDYDPEEVAGLTTRQLTDKLADPDKIMAIADMPSARWQILRYAQRVAERKLQICNKNLATRGFFTTASSS